MSAPCFSPARGLLAGLLLAAASTALAAPPPPWDFKDGDRVVFVGDTFIEREQRDGYLETALTLANVGKRVTFRNLGWSADTVRGLSRAGFDPPEAGFRELVKQITDAEPTVLVVGYGMAESFDGEAGLPRFIEGYNGLLDAVAPLGARLVLLSPLPHEKLPPPLPDPTAHNRDLKLYADAIRTIAEARDAAFIDLFNLVSLHREARAARGGPPRPDTDDGLHPTELGWLRLANMVGLGLKRGPISPSRTMSHRGRPIQFEASHPMLLPSTPGDGERPSVDPSLTVGDLPPGSYTLKVDGRPIATATAEEWGAGHSIGAPPEAARVEELRQAIIAKNRLFFHRWRPQNITYLFGFRKHEQGQNAVEVPRFDPLIEAREAEIAELLKPVPHAYELIREPEAAR